MWGTTPHAQVRITLQSSTAKERSGMNRFAKAKMCYRAEKESPGPLQLLVRIQFYLCIYCVVDVPTMTANGRALG